MPEPKAKSAPSPFVNGYLIAYNGIQFIGWMFIFTLTLKHLITEKAHIGLWNAVEMYLKIFQTAMTLEIFHGMIRIVKSNPVMALFQIFSRMLVVWGIADCSKEAQASLGIPLLLFTWTITEMVRYSFYFLNLFSSAPSFIIWCRYTFFYILYPMGVTGELLCMVAALPYLKKSGIYSFSLPNRWNVSFNYYYMILIIMLSYIPVFPQLYFHMIGQRKKVLNPKKSD